MHLANPHTWGGVFGIVKIIAICYNLTNSRKMECEKMRTRQKQRIIIGTLCAVIIGLAVGYAVLSQQLNIQGTGGIASDFNILFTDIGEGTMNGATTINKQITASTTATFTIDLEKPSSNGEYLITVENRGTLDAYVESINGIDEANSTEPTDITFSIEDIKVNDKLKAKESKVFKVKAVWNSNSTSIPNTNKDLTLSINFAQDTGSTTPSEDTIISTVDNLLDSSTDGTYNYMDGTYLKGEQTTNYVWFDGFLWRIMGKNADGSIRMITEENVTAIPWGSEDTAQDYDNSYVNDWLNNYFYPKLEHKDLLVNQTWCSETTTSSSSSRTTCTNNLSSVQKPVGLLSLDEYNLASGDSSYLLNLQNFWTTTPESASYAWYVHFLGSVYDYIVTDTRGVRPVANIKFDVTITSGNGTLTDPYLIGEVSDVTGSLKDNSHVGEYVTYAGRNYRVVETSNQGTKLILDGYYDSNNDGTIEEADKMAYGENCTLCTTINEDSFINWISNNNEIDKNKLVSTTWYRGDYWTGGDYKTNLESTSNPYVGRVGLIRVGEILASQSETILSNSHTASNNSGNAQNYWTVTPFSSSNGWYVHSQGPAGGNTATITYAVRPVIMIGPDVQITSGNGYQLS